MNYELAKQLKDAGFPFPNGEGFWWILDMDIWKMVDTPALNFIAKQVSERSKSRVMPEHYRIIPLPELIEACGDGFERLIRIKTGVGGVIFQAQGGLDNYQVAQYATPEEAVAKLWIALHT